MTNNTNHAVWSLGCSSLARPMKRVGVELHAIRRFEHYFRAMEDAPLPRCMLVHADRLPDVSVGSAVRSLRRHWPLVDVVIWAPDADASFVRQAFRAGAKDVLLSAQSSEVVNTIEQIIEEQRLLPRMTDLTDDLSSSTRFEGLVSRSPKMWDLFHTCMNIAKTDATVLIWGETGTGKELIARALHRRSERKGAFVVLDCGAVPESLIDSELFGHVKGAFTGATQEKKGLFRHADGGTLFLDELANVPLEVQFRLLRTLQEGTIRPVGGHDVIPVDVRVIAATNESLEKKVQAGEFREDLMYRLSVLYLEVPPLRERHEDIVFLFAYFTRKLSEHYNIERPKIKDDFLDGLIAYDWPGNVRQLENFVERLLLTNANKELTRADFEHVMAPFHREDEYFQSAHPVPVRQERPEIQEQDLSSFLRRAEREYLSSCLEECGGHVGQSAVRAGISRRSFTRKMKQHGLSRAQFLGDGQALNDE